MGELGKDGPLDSFAIFGGEEGGGVSIEDKDVVL